jgi:hypothetical protein
MSRRIFSAALFLLVWLLLPALPVLQTQTAGISAPVSGSTLSGVVLVQGTAANANFLRYELAFLQESNSGAGWIVFADGSQPVVEGTLAVWDTTVGRNVGAPVFPDGRYQLRLRVVRNDFNYDEYFATGLTIANNVAAPVATVTPQPPAPVPTVTLAAPPSDDTPPEPPAQEGEPEPTVDPAEFATLVPNQTRIPPTLVPGNNAVPPPPPPDLLPTLTPFPTPSPRATIARERFSPISREQAEQESGSSLLDGVITKTSGRMGSAFMQGMQIVFLAFGALAIYLLVRGAVRWLWRTIASLW